MNIGLDGSIDYLKSKNIKFTLTNYNSGICEGVNRASKLSSYDFIVYAHDDFYFVLIGINIFMKKSINWDTNIFIFRVLPLVHLGIY